MPIVILKTKDMRNSTNIFLTNLSIADLLVLLVCTPTVLVEVNTKPETWVLGHEMCKLNNYCFFTTDSPLTILNQQQKTQWKLFSCCLWITSLETLWICGNSDVFKTTRVDSGETQSSLIALTHHCTIDWIPASISRSPPSTCQSNVQSIKIKFLRSYQSVSHHK